MATTKNKSESVFVLDDDMLEAVAPKGRGRTAQPSIYLDAVQDAKHGTVYGIRGTATLKVPYIAGQLRKAARQLNDGKPDAEQVKITVMPREDHPKFGPFVAWKVDPAQTPEPASK